MPEVTLSLPVALGLLAVFIIIGALALFFTLKATDRMVSPTTIPSPTDTATVTFDSY